MAKHLNEFGGHWTEDKIEIFLKYLYAYLQIMKDRGFELIYFDGFAGCGTIQKEAGNIEALIESVAIRVLALEHAQRFSIYYLVEKDKQKANQLESIIKVSQKDQDKVYIVAEDCNEKLLGLANYLREHRYSRALCFIDPFGMTINWNSLAAFEGLDLDMWLLVPTGIGVNRLLQKKGEIPDAWFKKLEAFLGLTQDQIKNYFYAEKRTLTLFGEEEEFVKKDHPIHRIAQLYKRKLTTIFQYVTEPYPMRNSTGSIMYHFLLATNNKNGKKIGDEIIGKKLKEEQN